jgi:NDP-sugar pyrophosphorylase family protein
MITVCGQPHIHRIMNHYINFGHTEFIIALGYKGNLIKKYGHSTIMHAGVILFLITILTSFFEQNFINYLIALVFLGF